MCSTTAMTTFWEESQSILLGQFTTDGVLSGTVNLQMFTGGLGENEVDILGLSFEGVGLHKPQRRSLWLRMKARATLTPAPTMTMGRVSM